MQKVRWKMKRVVQGCIIVVLFSVTAWANAKLPAIISDNMVIQAEASGHLGVGIA